MFSKRLNKIISVLIITTFFFTNINTSYASPGSKSLFKNKKVDYDKISNQSKDILQKKQSIIKGEDAKELESQERASKKILQSNLSDISQIHIPQELGRVVEVHQGTAGNVEDTAPLIVGIQDLHTNPEAELNLAKILEILLKDYNMGLVCSEGAVGKVDTSSVSSFPDSSIREKVSRIFINSGELTGEEYLSITKYPELPIWGIETKDIYFDNIIGFNKIMKFNPQSQTFISQVKKAITQLKPKIYSKDLLDLDQKEAEFSSQKLDTAKYIEYLMNRRGHLSVPYGSNSSFNDRYRNIALLNETIQMEKTIDQLKIMKDFQNLHLNLQSTLHSKSLNNDLDGLIARANLFKDQKISPFSFYSYLKDLALKHLKEDFAIKYPELNSFVDYLTKVNSLDSTKLFTELEDLNFEIKESLSKTDEQKTLVKADHNINFLESFFNLKVSNEDLDYYLNNKDSHKVAFFKDFLPKTLKRYNINAFIDYNPDLIDFHLQELEDFYKVVKDRDIAMVTNAIFEIEKRNVKLATLIHGGFHTKGITKLLKEKGYSYIIVSPYSKTDIDEENYHFLLSGRRKPITELLKQLDLSRIVTKASKTLRVPLAFDSALLEAFNERVVPEVARIWGLSTEQVTPQGIASRIGVALAVEAGGDIAKLEKWRNPLVKADVRVTAQGAIILKLTPKDGEPEYFRITKDRVESATEADFKAGKTIAVARTKPADKTDKLTNYRTYADELGVPELAVLDEAEKTYDEWVYQTPSVQLGTHQATKNWLSKMPATATIRVYLTDKDFIDVDVNFIPKLISLAAIRVGTLNGQEALFLLHPGNTYVKAVDMPFLEAVKTMKGLGESITNEEIIRLMSPEEIHDITVEMSISDELIERYKAELKRFGGTETEKREMEDSLSALEKNRNATGLMDAYRVVHSTTRGPGKGGIRFTHHGDFGTVRTLAAIMAWKCALAGIPYGGAKAECVFILKLPNGESIKIDPRLLPLKDKAKVDRSLARGEKGTKGLAHIIGPLRDVPAGDVNTSAFDMGIILDEILRICVENDTKDIDGIPVPLEVLREAKMAIKEDFDPTKTYYVDAIMDAFKQGRIKSVALMSLITGKPFTMDGEPTRDLAHDWAGGHAYRNDATGVTQARITKHAIDSGIVKDKTRYDGKLFTEIEGATASYQGFGNVGIPAALESHMLGVKVMGLSDVSGSIYVTDGQLPVDKIVAWFKARQKPLLYDWYKEEGAKLGVKHDSEGNFVLFMDVDMIFPDAKEGQLTGDNADNVKAIIVSEGANAPTTPEADKIFQAKGIRVIPDFLANGGGVIGSYFEWLQTLTITLEELKTATQEEMYKQGKRQVVEISNKALDSMIQYCIDNKIPFTQLRQVAIILAIKKILKPEDFAEHTELAGKVVVGSDQDGKPTTKSAASLLSKQGEELPVSARIIALAHEIFADPEILANLTKDTLAAVALQYGLSRGHPILLNYLSGMLGKEGITAHPDTDVVILDGITDAEHILAKLLITKDDTVVYQAGSLSEQDKDIYKYYGAELIEIDLSTIEGVAELEKKLKSEKISAAKLKFIQVLSDTEEGAEALSQDTRNKLIDLAKKYDLLLVEDGRYRQSVLSNKANSLKALDGKGPESRVIQLRNLSRLFGKEAELGCAYLVMPSQFAVKAEAAKSSITLHPNGLVQAIVYKELLNQYGSQKFKFSPLTDEEKNPQLSQWLSDKLSDYGKNVKLSEIRRILKLMNIEGLVSFAGGMPAIELFPYEDTERLIADFSADEWKVALGKSHAQGLEMLRRLLAERLNKENNLEDRQSLTEKNIIITEGSQDGLDLLGWLVRGISDERPDRNNVVITQKPTYLGFMSAAEPYGCKTNPYDLNSLEGLQKLYDDLNSKRDTHEPLPSLIYVMPTFGNPNGDVMSLEARERLLEIANEFEIMIAEDNPYGALRYNEESYQPTLLELSKADKYDKVRVIYLGTVSKTFTPGMRIGWTVAPEAIINKLTEYKEATAGGANPLNQLLAAKFITTGLIDTHVKDVLIAEYSKRRAAMIAALEKYMPEGVSWTEGHGGYFIWVTLPEKINTEALLVEMTDKDRVGIKLGFVPGWPFLGGSNQLRLSFPTNSPKVIDAGIQALAVAIKDKLGILAETGGGAAAEDDIVGIALDNIVSKIARVSDRDAAVQLLKDNNGPAHAYFRYSIARSVAQILKERLKSGLVQVYLFEREDYDSTALIGDDIDITVYLEDDVNKEDLRDFLTSLDEVLVRAYIDLGVDFSNGALLQPRIINREDVKQGREFTAFLQDANIMTTLAPLPMLASDVTAARGGDKGVITKEEHEAMRGFLKKADAHNEKYARHDMEEKFDVRGKIRVYSVPGMFNATGFKGHYAIRDGIVYIDKDILEGKDGELYLRHEIFELEQILNFGRTKFQGVKGKRISEQEIRAKLVKWLDEEGPIGEVRAILLKFHNQAPELPDEDLEIIADVPASRGQAVTNLVAATTDEANIKAVVSNVYVPTYGTAGKDVVKDYISGRITLQDATTRLSAANDSIADVNIAKIILIAAYLGAKHKLYALGQSGIEVYLSGTPAKDARSYIQMDRRDLTPEQIQAILEEADTLAKSAQAEELSARPVRGAAAGSGAANTGLAPTYSFLNDRLKDMDISVDGKGQLTYSEGAKSRGLNRDYEQAGMRTVGNLLDKKVIGKLAQNLAEFLAIKETVLYNMIHGLVPTPRQKIQEISPGGSKKGWSTLNFTAFGSELKEFPDGEIVKTTGHFNAQTDIQQVGQGEFISLQIKYDVAGNPVESRAQYLKPGDIFYALAGYFHVTIPVGEGPHSFFDIGYADGKYKEAKYDWPNGTPAPYLFVNRDGKITMVLNPDYKGKDVSPIQWYTADKLPEAQGQISLIDLYARANEPGMAKILDAIEKGMLPAGIVAQRPANVAEEVRILTDNGQMLRFGTSGLREFVKNMQDRKVYTTCIGWIEYAESLRELDVNSEDPEMKTIYLAEDLRYSSPRFARAFARAAYDKGYTVKYIGKIPTPVGAYYSQYAGKKQGLFIMITGSHIPSDQYDPERDQNGIKFYMRGREVLNSDVPLIYKNIETAKERIYGMSEEEAKKMWNPDGSFVDETDHLDYSIDQKDVEDLFIKRYVDFFGADAYKGKKILIWQHTSVARDFMKRLFEALGAQVVTVDRREEFYAMDTEDIKPEQQKLMNELAEKEYLWPDGTTSRPFRVASADGDGDRPVYTDEKGNFIFGDRLNMPTIEILGIKACAAPISVSRAVTRKLEELGVLFLRTKIGSPIVIKAMEFLAEHGFVNIDAFEVNGGNLLGTDIRLPNGRVLKKLATRDAFLPQVCADLLAIKRGVMPSEVFAEYEDFQNYSLLRDLVAPDFMAAVINRLAPSDSKIREVKFLEDGKVEVVYYVDQEEGPKRAAEGDIKILDEESDSKIIAELKEKRDFLQRFFNEREHKGERLFGKIVEMNFIDGIQLFFASKDRGHIRGSSNSPQFRFYPEVIKGDLSVKEAKNRAVLMAEACCKDGALGDEWPILMQLIEAVEREALTSPTNEPASDVIKWLNQAGTKVPKLLVINSEGKAQELPISEIIKAVQSNTAVWSKLSKGGFAIELSSLNQAIAKFKESPMPLKIHCGIQHYDWGERGDTAFIPALLRIDNSDGKPFAELWIGAHPSLPAKANVARIEINLNDLISGAADEILGKEVAEQLNRQLPYLLKVLAAGKMLSIQAHPNREQAQAGFERENAEDISIRAFNRNYKDANHKPEIIVAIKDFYALNGFRPLEEIAGLLLDDIVEMYDIMPEFRQRLKTINQDTEQKKQLIKELYSKIMVMSQEEVDIILTSLVSRLKTQNELYPFNKDNREFWVLKADEQYTKDGHIDRGIFSIYLLNFIHLRHGEAMYLGAGELHAYLEGVGMECMANSDNVLRGGLTPKYVDASELLKVLTFNSGKPEILRARQISSSEALYDTPAEEFALSVIDVTPGKPHKNSDVHSADALIVLEGNVEVKAKGKTLSLKKGDTVIIPAILGEYEITGQGKLYKTSVPLKAATILEDTRRSTSTAASNL